MIRLNQSPAYCVGLVFKFERIEDIKENKVIKNKQKKLIKEPIQKKKKDVVVTKEHLYKFMEKKGTKDKRIQDVILDTCIGKVGDSDLRKLFKEVFNYYNTKSKKCRIFYFGRTT